MEENQMPKEKRSFAVKGIIGMLMICLLPLLAMASTDTSDVMHNLKFRNIGPPAAGGRVSAVAGIPGQPSIYYVGAAGGGVFKSVDGGISWKHVFKREAISSIGAIAVAPSNPNFVRVGTGEANLRNDIITGKGVYFSPDAGKSWSFMGLKDVGQISKIVVDPSNPDNVFVAAVGHAWAPNKDRGVFRTTDGGKTWEKVLFVNDTTGASSLVMDPGNPKVLFAGMWQVLRHPWALEDGGDGSGVYRSTDGGSTWKRLTEGLPTGPLGRIAVAAAPSNPDHIYAIIESKKGLLWDSKDLGDHWEMVSNNHELDVRPFYFSNFVVSPDNDNKLFFLSFLITESTDGGKTVKNVNGDVHVDHHAIWIDPDNANRIIIGNDGGAFLSVDGAKTWRFLNNIPIEQFYQVAVDSCRPFNLGGGLQDNNAWYGVSSNLNGRGVTGQNWFTVAGGDGEYVVPAPSDPQIVYAESQDAFLKRLDLKTGLSRYIRPYLYDSPDMPPSELKYRFNWTTPIAVSYTDANEVYLGANVLFKTMDGGLHWTVISPDLTRNDKSKQRPSGGDINLDMSGAENYDTILSIAISPLDSNVIWVGTDDGVVQVTRDGGQHWESVAKNIAHLPEWGRVYQVEPSPFTPGGCYVTFDLHELDNNRPYVFKTSDFGKTWTSISKGLPEDYPAHVVREDPNLKGFLVAGTDNGLYYSRNDGAEWMPVKSNFPTACVYDMKFEKRTHDLVVATHGNGIFILDNITPLEEYDTKVADEQFHLFNVLPAFMYHMWNKDAFDDLSTYSAPNQPYGVMIDYYLKDTLSAKPAEMKEHKTPIEIKISDVSGNDIATLYGPDKKGFNRLVWNMRYQGASPLLIDPKMAMRQNPYNTRGPMVTPGTYKITVTAAGKTETAQTQVLPDPRFTVPENYFTSNTLNGLAVRNQVSALNSMLNRIQNIDGQMATLRKSLSTDEQGMKDGKYKSVLDELSKLGKKLTTLKDTLYSSKVQHDVEEDDIHDFTHLDSRIEGLMFSFFTPYGGVPSDVTLETMKDLGGQLDSFLGEFNSILTNDVPAFNKVAQESGVPTLFAGPVVEVKK
jgi:photosystem II stability/assembly factor-like uncharacterized protein